MRLLASMRIVTKPASRSTFRCFETVGWPMSSELDDGADRLLVVQQQVEDRPAVRFGQGHEYRHTAILPCDEEDVNR